MYNKLVLNYFNNPRHVGTFPEDANNIITKMLGNKDTNFFAQLQIQCVDGKILEARFKACGDPYLIALMSYVTEFMTRNDTQTLSADELVHLFELPDLKKHYAALVLGLV